MQTRLFRILVLGVSASATMIGTASAAQAAEHCIITDPVIVLEHQVLPSGTYCIPI